MPNDVMGNEGLSGRFGWIILERKSPMNEDGRAKVLGIGFEVFGLEVAELAEEGHWQYYPVHRITGRWQLFSILKIQLSV